MGLWDNNEKVGKDMEGPMIFTRSMSELSPYKRKRLCEHEPKCDKFLVINTMNEGFTLCEKDAGNFANNIFHELGIMPEVKHKRNTFTEEQTREIIEIMRQYERIPHGTYVVLAEKYGKTRAQLKSHVWYLRSRGAF